jgi:hypothetical protein
VGGVSLLSYNEAGNIETGQVGWANEWEKEEVISLSFDQFYACEASAWVGDNFLEDTRVQVVLIAIGLDDPWNKWRKKAMIDLLD